MFAFSLPFALTQSESMENAKIPFALEFVVISWKNITENHVNLDDSVISKFKRNNSVHRQLIDSTTLSTIFYNGM